MIYQNLKVLLLSLVYVICCHAGNVLQRDNTKMFAYSCHEPCEALERIYIVEDKCVLNLKVFWWFTETGESKIKQHGPDSNVG